MDRRLSRARVLDAGDRLLDAALGAEHRVPRTRPSGRDGRSGLARRPLFRRRHPSASRPRRGADGGAYHLSLGAALHRKFGRRMQDRDLPTFSFDADFQVESYLRYQGSSFVERFDANCYLYLDAGDGLFRHRRRPWRRAGEGLRRHQDALLRGVVHVGLAVPDRGIARAGACAQRVERAGVVRRNRNRSRPRRLPARRARVLRHLPRLPGIRRQGARPR